MIEKGVNVGFTNREKYTLTPGTFIIINPGDLHAGHSYNKHLLRFKSITFTEEYLHFLLAKNKYPNLSSIYFSPKPFKNFQLLQIFNSIFSKNSQERKEEQWIQLFSFLLRYQSDVPAVDSSEEEKKRYIKQTIAFIKDNYRKNFTLDELANAVYVSKFHLVREFKKNIGLTPFQYLNCYRVEKSKEINTRSNLVGEKLYEAGFYDHSHFSKHFKKVEGISPSAYFTQIYS